MHSFHCSTKRWLLQHHETPRRDQINMSTLRTSFVVVRPTSSLTWLLSSAFLKSSDSLMSKNHNNLTKIRKKKMTLSLVLRLGAIFNSPKQSDSMSDVII